ncbi:MAG: 7-cyano-7-deazaguanine synthase QueC [Ignavibacteriaceae bacterium]|jgi:7-cyano-7-deazaguanine synthase|nr:7-cyano-7-deazaguanine synthase QueC [Ignavibacteriaceae bacterium]
MFNQKAIIALSGGLDSCVTAAIASENYELALAHFNYGQRTEERELKAFIDIADFYNVKERLIVDFTHFPKIGGSSLTDYNIPVPEGNAQNLSIPNTYVPFRNANILSACVSWAEIIFAEKVFIGAVHEDSSGYPDCKPSFFNNFNALIKEGTKREISIVVETPVIGMSKAEIVKKGIELNAPLHLTWSCYQNSEKACGICDSCQLRLKGFQNAGYIDPIEYMIDIKI